MKVSISKGLYCDGWLPIYLTANILSFFTGSFGIQRLGSRAIFGTLLIYMRSKTLIPKSDSPSLMVRAVMSDNISLDVLTGSSAESTGQVS